MRAVLQGLSAVALVVAISCSILIVSFRTIIPKESKASADFAASRPWSQRRTHETFQSHYPTWRQDINDLEFPSVTQGNVTLVFLGCSDSTPHSIQRLRAQIHSLDALWICCNDEDLTDTLRSRFSSITNTSAQFIGGTHDQNI